MALRTRAQRPCASSQRRRRTIAAGHGHASREPRRRIAAPRSRVDACDHSLPRRPSLSKRLRRDARRASFAARRNDRRSRTRGGLVEAARVARRRFSAVDGLSIRGLQRPRQSLVAARVNNAAARSVAKRSSATVQRRRPFATREWAAHKAWWWGPQAIAGHAAIVSAHRRGGPAAALFSERRRRRLDQFATCDGRAKR